MDQPPATSPRRLHWQLSLRMMLLLIALVGVGLTVYRWPWVESEWVDVPKPTDPFGNQPAEAPPVLWRYEQRTTFRRNWRAQAVRNGVEETWRDSRLWRASHYYEGELHGPQRVYDAQGKITYEVHFRHGQYHGPAFCRYGNDFKWKGEFVEGRPHGPWQTIVSYDSQFASYDPADWVELDNPESTWLMKAPVRVLTNWDRGKRHGLWTSKWLDSDAVLRTAEYDYDDLTRWNGEPVVEQFLARLKRNPDKDGVQATLQFLEAAKSSDCRVGYLSSSGIWGLCLACERDGAAPEKLFVHSRRTLREGFGECRAKFTPALCEFAAKCSCRLEYRYGGLLLVSKDENDQPFVDRTGIDEVKFEAGSPPERDWNKVIAVVSSPFSGNWCVRELLEGTSIQVEVDQSIGSKYRTRRGKGEHLFHRQRRDAIGLVCYLSGLQCQQHGDKLVFTLAPGQTADQALDFPLQIPDFP